MHGGSSIYALAKNVKCVSTSAVMTEIIVCTMLMDGTARLSATDASSTNAIGRSPRHGNKYPRITRAWKKTSERYLVFTKGFDCILNHPKVAAYGYGRSQWFQHNGLPSSDPSRDFWMTSFPLFEKSTGERIGPVVSYTNG